MSTESTTALPPLDAPALYARGPTGQHGPISANDLVRRIAAGEIGIDVSVWHEGLPAWMRLRDHAALRDLVQRAGGAAGAQLSGASEDDRLDAVFGDLVRASWKYFHATEFATHVDEVFLGALITSTLDNGYSLIDISSTGANHYLRFERIGEGSRIVYKMQHLASGLVASKVLGHMASVVIGYGERIQDFGRIWSALKAEYKSGLIQNAEPGTVTVDADVTSQYVYVQVDLYWNISDYVGADYTIDVPKMTSHVGACVHALRKYLHGRMR